MLTARQRLVEPNVVVPSVNANVRAGLPVQVAPIQGHDDVLGVGNAREREADEGPRVRARGIERRRPRSGGVEHRPRVRLQWHHRALYTCLLERVLKRDLSNEIIVKSMVMVVVVVAVVGRGCEPVCPWDRVEGNIVRRVRTEIGKPSVVFFSNAND